eukprot:TRINITY_DN1307_c0_g1_i2.p1 TRINITY_DN1307_c0_g1~~TRINITY_DN1307_c0_g1_i2.p1  ORF type:complete len:157 (-),score=12.40 TRINITY_DN1307_c0_g1_i2:441-911(-)
MRPSNAFNEIIDGLLNKKPSPGLNQPKKHSGNQQSESWPLVAKMILFNGFVDIALPFLFKVPFISKLCFKEPTPAKDVQNLGYMFVFFGILRCISGWGNLRGVLSKVAMASYAGELATITAGPLLTNSSLRFRLGFQTFCALGCSKTLYDLWKFNS